MGKDGIAAYIYVLNSGRRSDVFPKGREAGTALFRRKKHLRGYDIAFTLQD